MEGIVWRIILHKESKSARVVGDHLKVDFHVTLKNSAKLHMDLPKPVRVKQSQDQVDSGSNLRQGYMYKDMLESASLINEY